MKYRSVVHRFSLTRAAILFGFVTAILIGSSSAIRAADQEFVGILALAIEDDVASQLGLSKSTRQQLIDLIDERESDAIDLALSLRDLTATERAKKLNPFRKKSEQLGLKLLSEQQRESLEAIRIGQIGMPMLADPIIAKKLKLTQEQQQQVAKLLGERKAATQNRGRSAAKQAQSNYDRQLKAVLTVEQIAAWQSLTKPAATQEQTAGRSKLAATQPKTSSQKSPVKSTSTGGKLSFSFRYAPWADVIEWFASQADLSLMMDAPPQGTLNYTDNRDYTPAQAIDLLNSVLLTKGYTLVRRDQMLMVVNLEDGIPPNLITEVPIEKLDEYGEYELVRCLFTLRSAKAEEVETEISRLLGPQGKVDLLATSNQLSITETAGRLRTFRTILEASEQKNSFGNASMFSLQHVRANAVIESWRKLMGVPEDENATADGSLRVAKGKTSKQLVVTGAAHRVQEFRDLINLLDVPAGGGIGVDTPQIEVYAVTDADPESVLSVMEELLGDSDEVRLAVDPKTGSLVALATPDEHATIRATIDQMQQDRRLVEVIRLRTVDPQLAMLSIEKLFGPTDAEETPDPNAPRVDANPMSRSLLIRGSASQIKDIRSLLAKMGEQGSEAGDRSLTSGRGNLRMIPIDAATARRAMEQLNTIWPTVRKNRIRTVTPSSSIRGLRPGKDVSGGVDSEAPKRFNETGDNTTSTERTSNSNRGASVAASSHLSRLRERSSLSEAEGEGVGTRDKRDLGSAPKQSLYVVNQLSTTAETGDGSTNSTPDVIVTLGDQGLLIASEDTEALDEFEELFRALSDRLFTGSRELAIYYLKYAKADVAAEFLKQFIGGSGSSSGGGGTLLGNLAGAALGGGSGGGIVGSLLGLGGGSSASATISSGTTVIADPRLNAVVVQATPEELDFIEDLLEVLDTSSSPERIETIPRPQAIPILNTDAEEVAATVRSVYASRLSGGGSRQPRQPSPEDFIRAMSGQKNSGRSIQDAVSEQVRLTISVDKRRNALLVVAPQSLFEEIRELVAQLDFATPELSETIRYGRASGSSPDMIRNALTTIIGEAATKPSDSEKRTAAQKQQDTESQKTQQAGAEEMKRRMDFFRAIQNQAAKDRAAAQKKAAYQKGAARKE